MSPSPERFSEFFSALYGHPPFPWQTRLLQHVYGGAWPKTIALPTASGKTACIDIALFALACGAPNAPRRIFFVVDRRVIVDEAFERACKLSSRLSAATDGILAEVADALRGLASADTEPLACFQLRGGIYRDDSWARTPTQPTVICSTVDQIGSRLLYRSYGASPYQWPLHAGLAANDSLILLDEVHCSNPFRQTLESVARYRQWASMPIMTPFAYAVMSATPTDTGKPSFALDKVDHADPVLYRRLNARKPARLIECEKKEKTASPEFAKRLVQHAETLARQGARRIGVIVNRVATAREVFKQIAAPTERKALFIGRMRALDRDESMAEWRSRLEAGSTEKLNEPVFVVATQCLEVGANLDFDALVTECASLDALRQRFGRLYRLGEPDDVDPPVNPPAAIFIAADGLKDSDPIYGDALRNTWLWLQTKAQDQLFDFGVQSVDDCRPTDPFEYAKLTPESLDAPVMLPAHIDCWAQTSPEPWPSPDVALFLHGPQQDSAPDVQVCWRADLGTDESEQQWIDMVSRCPPTVSECISIPLPHLRKWLLGQSFSSPLTDLENQTSPESEEEEDLSSARRALRWRGENDSAIANAGDLKGGDTLVLPLSTGGWEVLGYLPPDKTSKPKKGDRGDEAQLRARAKVVLRLHRDLLNQYPDCAAKQSLLALINRDTLEEEWTTPEFRTELKDSLKKLLQASDIPLWLSVATKHLTASGKAFDISMTTGNSLVLTSRRKLDGIERQRLYRGHSDKSTSINDGDYSTEDDCASFTAPAQPVRLRAHLHGVAAFTAAFGRGCGLAENLVSDMTLAASLHDLGKADPRFQSWLRGGVPTASDADPGRLLAKSSSQSSAAARKNALKGSKYPTGSRHELLSVRLVESAPEILGPAHDRELVLHLVASHHGRCRPFAPVIEDESPVPVRVEWSGVTLSHQSRTDLERLDSGVAERFWRLIRRYGWWGLAYLEAIHVLADHRRSEWEQTHSEAES